MDVYKNPLYDDFTGFTFNGQHSSQFGLLRISNGDRYEDTLVLSHSDEAADIPGGPGQYYWGETLTPRVFPINVAYDNISEVDKRRIKQWLHPDDKLHELIFDERPYIKYWVKCSKEVKATELCFNEPYNTGTDMLGKLIKKNRRVYKGEFTIEFTAYMPYGIAVDKSLTYFDNYDNIEEWKEVSGLKSNLPNDNFIFNTDGNSNNGTVKIYNPGDIEVGFELIGNLDSNAILLTNGFSTTTADGLKVVSAILESLPESSLRVYINGQPQTIFADGEFPYVKAGEDKGIIISDNGRSQFESTNSGIIYDLYETTKDIKNVEYICTELNGLSKDYQVFAINNSIVYPIRVVDITEATNTITIQFLSEVSEIPTDLKIASPINWTANFFIDENKKFTLTVTAAATTHPNDWSEAQYFLFNGGQIKIDSNKYTVNWRKTEMDNWIGIAGIISDGSLFKLPVDNWEEFNNSDQLELNKLNTFIISVDSTIQNLSSATINYNYLYK